MAMSWAAIFPDVDGDPVVGEPSEFSSVKSMFQEMGTAAESIKSEFEQITSETASDSLDGAAADAFRTLVDDVAGSLGDLPGVCSSAEDVMQSHYSRLSDLRDAAEQALARARTRWQAHEDAKRALSSKQATSQALASQLDGLPPAGGDPADDAERTSLEGDAADARSALSAAEGALDGAAGDLEASRQEWDDLRADEETLDEGTASALGDISLGDLKDPSWWQSILGSAFELIVDLSGIELLLDLVEAIATGDWAAALWALREILDRVLMVVAIVALFTPLGPIVLALAAIKLATTVALYATQWPNPESGQTIGLTDVAMDGADFLGAAGDVAQAARLASAVPTGSVSRAVDAAGEAAVPAGRVVGNRPLSQLPKTYQRPSGYRRGVRAQAYDAARGPDGIVRDPLTGAEIPFDSGWHMGHRPGFEFRKHANSAYERGISRQQFLDEHNDPSHYRPELPSSNTSHSGEDQSDMFFGP